MYVCMCVCACVCVCLRNMASAPCHRFHWGILGAFTPFCTLRYSIAPFILGTFGGSPLISWKLVNVSIEESIPITRKKGLSIYQQMNKLIQWCLRSPNFWKPRFGVALARLRTRHAKENRRRALRLIKQHARKSQNMKRCTRKDGLWLKCANLNPVLEFLA